ncbi:MAG: trypsin-like peptidase domain-containing protein, partial [Lachnospiraceae bacterium]|nr:trypsin-like peptidase domain-containing protein [Lachnospiraceae bacterium]
MYNNDIYSGSDTGSNITGQFSGAQTNYTSYREVEPETSYSYDGMNGRGSDNGNNKGGRSGGLVKKVLLSVSMGLLFGIFAGAGFYAVQKGMGVAADANEPASAVIEDTAETDDDSDSSLLQASAEVSTISYVSSDVSEVVEEVMPAMVSIINTYTETSNFWGRSYSEEVAASGSGIIVAENDDELLIVTNNHVVEDADSLEVTFIDGATAEASIKGTDSDMDLAVIAVSIDALDTDTKAAITVATLGDSDNLKLGEPVIAIGNALGYGQSVTNGIISALDREIELEDGSTGTFIQTNAAINPGNSGGALLNIKGEVIGINSNKIGGEAIEGMGYAIPISSASPIIAELMERQTRVKVAESEMGYIGIELQEVNEQISATFNMPEGIYIVSTVEGGGADNAGLMTGDIITKFDGQKISSYEDLQDLLQYYAAGDTVSVTVMRPENGEYVAYEFELTLGEKPSDSSS